MTSYFCLFPITAISIILLLFFKFTVQLSADEKMGPEFKFWFSAIFSFFIENVGHHSLVTVSFGRLKNVKVRKLFRFLFQDQFYRNVSIRFMVLFSIT